VLAVEFLSVDTRVGCGRYSDNQGFGGDSGGVTPVPIPNTEVKPSSADGTWAETPWESRSPPDFSLTGSRSGDPTRSPAPRRCSAPPPWWRAAVRPRGEKIATRLWHRWGIGTFELRLGNGQRHRRPAQGEQRIVHLRLVWSCVWWGWLLENGREDSTQRVRSVVGRRVLADVTPSMKCLAGSACCGWGWSPVPDWHSGSGLDHC
jgi:hypothetical protein